MPACPKCGYENAADALFCNLCQESFKSARPAQEPPPAPAAPPRGPAAP
ncbi:MAG: serine/threonine protein phosphatase, partial [Elusimicrobia bacterium]|nr:serine/threonine protein phosphatase [Elusimicrobiota bacterium]